MEPASYTDVPTRISAASTTNLTSLAVSAEITGSTQSTVQVDGDVDLANAHLVAAALNAQLSEGFRFVTLDVSRVTFLDCAGLRVLVVAHNRFLAGSGALVLTGIGSRLARLLRITHLDKTLFVADALLIADATSYRRTVRHLTVLPATAGR